MRAERQTREAEHLKALRDVLGVRPDQEAAFQAYVSVMRPQRPDAGKMGGGRMGPEPVDMANMTTPERLDLMAKTMQAHQDMERARFDRMATATKAFYADLSPEQKRVMDALPELDHGEDWGNGGPIGHRGPHPHPGGPGPMGEAH